MRIALLATDVREHVRDYTNTHPTFGTAPEALLQGFAMLPETEVHVVSCAKARMKSPEKLAPNIFFHSLYVARLGWMRTAFQGCVRATRRKLKEIRPDIAHGQGTEGDCALDAVFSGFPNVVTIHGNMRLIAKVTRARPFSFPWLAARLERMAVPRAGGVVCITRYTQEAVSSLAKRTWVLSNAVDCSFFEVRPQPSMAAPPRVLCVGHVCVRKNQNAFIQALDPLAKRRKFTLTFLGEAQKGAPYADEFLKLVQARPWCEHGGFVDRQKLKEQLRAATLVVLPSLEDNCPMVVLEAMAASVPVVAAEVGGVPELIQDGRTGWLCNPLQAESMRSAIESALSDSSGAAEVARRANEQAQERFHPRVIARRHLEIYREVLQRDA